jgi:hypothetical protein
MRTEEGVWCDIAACRKAATYVHMCKVEGSEFAMCKKHEQEWKGKTNGRPDFQIRCPRCLPLFIAAGGGRDAPKKADGSLPDPITGPLADAFDRAMYLEGILGPTRQHVLRRLAATEDTYVRAIFRSTAAAHIARTDDAS